MVNEVATVQKDGRATCLVAAILLTLVLCLASDKVTVSVLWNDERIKVIDLYFPS